MEKKHSSIGIIAFPVSEISDAPDETRAGNTPFSNLVDILHSLFTSLYVITGNTERVSFKKDEKMHISVIPHQPGTNLFSRIANYMITQVRLSLKLYRLSKKVNVWFFFIGAEALVLPMLTAKLSGKRTILALTGFPSGLTREEKEPFYKIINMLTKTNFTLADRIITYSERIVNEHDLVKYRNKITIASEHLLNLERFKTQRDLNQRARLVAYVGRLSKGKGVPELIEAIKALVATRDDINFLIGGDGSLRDWLGERLSEADLSNRTKFVGWISNYELPDYLNQCKLLVLPSYTEALPNIILEAMACGTPVLSTAVGAITDIIEDGKTGFIMENNFPECIAENIIRALQHPDLEQISYNARKYVEGLYTYDVVLEKYRRALNFD